MEILLVTSNLPYPPVTGEKIRIWNLLVETSRKHNVTVLSLVDSPDEISFLPNFKPYSKRVETVIKQRHRSRKELFMQILKRMLKGQPPRNGIAYFKDMELKIQEVVENGHFDIIQIENSHMAPYIEFINNTSATHLITLHNAGAIQYERMSRLHSDLQSRFWSWLDWLFLRNWEPDFLARNFDKCIVVSSVDEAELFKANPNLDLVVIPNGVDTRKYDLLPEALLSKNIIFTGKMNYIPNVDGITYFCREIFPIIKRSIPDAKLLIVGMNPTSSVQALASDDVIVTGDVKSVIPFYQESLISIVPLRAGGGTRLKILESLALGRPVVSTSLGCEGLDVLAEDSILIADSPIDFANSVIRLFSDEELRQRLRINGRALVEKRYDWRVIGQQLLQVYDSIGFPRQRSASQ